MRELLEQISDRNPELKRNFWLELSTTRLIAMTVILASIFIMVLAVSSDYNPMGRLSNTAMGVYYALVVLWGTKLVIDSVIEEVNDRTWIQQQMTALTPWQMTIGKLFGATSYAWFGGLISIAVVGLVALASDERTAGYGEASLFAPLVTILSLLITGVGIHAFAGMLTINLIDKQASGKKVGSTGLYILIIVSIAFVYRWQLGLTGGLKTTWYGIDFNVGVFSLLTSGFFAFWSVIGMNQVMKRELQIPSNLKIWSWFLYSLTIYLSGFAFSRTFGGRIFPVGDDALTVWTVLFYLNFLVFGILTFVLVFLEPKHAVIRRKLMRAIELGDKRRIGQLLPLWLPTLALTGVLAIITAIVQASSDQIGFKEASVPAMFPVAAFVFLLRDVAFVLLMNMTGKRKTPDAAAFIYIMVSHSVIPFIFSGSGHAGALALFLPTTHFGSAPSLLSGGVQAAVVIVLLLRALRGNMSVQARA